jgi:hypothetical protein
MEELTREETEEDREYILTWNEDEPMNQNEGASGDLNVR